jgi:hypothetical protein
MDKKLLREILSAHADRLVDGEATSQDYLRLLSEQEDELASLLDMAEKVQSTLTPITPAEEFEEELKRQLLTTAHIRRVEGYKPPHPFRDLLVALAAIAFVASLAGILLAMRARSRPKITQD